MALVAPIAPLAAKLLPAGVRARTLPGINGLAMHILEAGHEGAGRPLVLLLHGFPELAYSWRKIIPPLAAAGYHVVAPDLRGYGRTTGWDDSFDAPLRAFHILNIVRDVLSLIDALGARSVAMVAGHDYGSPVAAWCTLVRPDVFRSVVLMSAPFPGPPGLRPPAAGGAAWTLDPWLARLPRPRKHYHSYYATRQANGDMMHCAQGLHAFLRAYYHTKSADWPANTPHPLTWSAEELAKLPTYYVMDLDRDMAETVAPEMPAPEAIAACRWLTEAELAVYSAEYGRTGFQGGLNWYRTQVAGLAAPELRTFAGRRIEVPSAYIAGRSDWGIHQSPGAFEAMRTTALADMRGCHLVLGAGHWVQQEQAETVSTLLIDFLHGAQR